MSQMSRNLKELQENLGYKFNDISFLEEALTHSSYANENPHVESNERMEFLGDAVLSIVSAEFLYLNYPNTPEGKLSKMRAGMVCTSALAGYATELDLGNFILLGKGEIHVGGEKRPSILENTFEAVIAAIYLDGGMENAKKFVLRFLKEEHKSFKDYKTQLQEVVQQNPEEKLSYVITAETGPDHDKTFEAEVHLNSNVIGKGTGKTKKQAEQEAAREALQLMGL